MSKVYKCDICGRETPLKSVNKFKRTLFGCSDFPDHWTTRKFDICYGCLSAMENMMKQIKRGKTNE